MFKFFQTKFRNLKFDIASYYSEFFEIIGLLDWFAENRGPRSHYFGNHFIAICIGYWSQKSDNVKIQNTA